MSYWKKIKSTLSQNNEENESKLKILADVIVKKTKEGSESFVEKSQEEFETLKLKYDLHKKKKEMLKELGDLGGLFFDYKKEKKDSSNDSELEEKYKKVSQIENECKNIEGALTARGALPSLENKDFEVMEKHIPTPY